MGKLRIATLCMASSLGASAMCSELALPPIQVERITRVVDFGVFETSRVDFGGSTESDPVKYRDAAVGLSCPTFTADLGLYDAIILRVQAPPGQRFSVQYHPAYTEHLELVARWAAGGFEGTTIMPAITFEGLTGTSPLLDVNSSQIASDGTYIEASAAWSITGAYEFDAMVVTLPYDRSLITGGERYYGSIPVYFNVLATGTTEDASLRFFSLVPEPTGLALLPGALYLATRRPRRPAVTGA